MTRTLIRSALAVAVVASLAACASNSSKDAKNDSTSSSSTDAPTTSATGPDLSDDAAAKRAFPLPTDLAAVLPAPEAVKISSGLKGYSGKYQPVVSTPIPTAPANLPWALSTLGGVENTYNFNIDVSDESGDHAVRLTVRTLLFEDDGAALDALTARRAQLAESAYAAPYGFAPNSFNIRYKTTQGQFQGVSGVISAKGAMVAEVIFEDSDRAFDWTQTCSMVMEDVLSGVLERYPAIAPVPLAP